MKHFVTFLLFFQVALPAPAQGTIGIDELRKRLDEVARIGSIMVDGDVCQRITTQRAKEYMVKKDPRDRWIDGDNFDVNAQPYIETKKTLMRLARLVDFPCDVNLWMPLDNIPGHVQVLIRNVHELSQFWSFGQLHQQCPPEMSEVLSSGKRVTVERRPGMISVLAPIHNSLGDTVGLLEAVTQVRPDPRENVK